MSIMKDACTCLLVCLLASAPITPASYAQDNSAQALPETELQFRHGKIADVMTEITPDVVQTFAKKGQIRGPRGRPEQTISLEAFFEFSEKRAKEKKAGVFIAVVVDSKPYLPLDADYHGRDHFNAVRTRVNELMTNDPGFAELYGAEVQGVLPLRYYPDAQVHYPGDFTIPIELNDILVKINDNPLIFHNADEDESAEYGFIDEIWEMETLLSFYFSRDVHRYSYDEHIAHQEAITAAAKRRYGDHFKSTRKERAEQGISRDE